MEESTIGWVALKLLFVLLLVLANGFFVSSEFALVSVRRSRIAALAEQGHRGAKAVIRLLENPTIFLSTTQFGVTLASLALGWIGESTLAGDILMPLLALIVPSSLAIYISAHAVAIPLAFAIITFFHIVLGEIIPKTIALEKTQKIALVVARPLEAFYKVFSPFINALNRSSVYILRMFGLRALLAHAIAYSEEELRQIVSMSYQGGVLNEYERKLIQNIFDFTDKSVREVMVPRTEVAALASSLSFEQVLQQFQKSGYSRMPVYKGQLDNIKGVVHSKDLMKYFSKPDQFDLMRVARKPLFIPDTASLDAAIRQMQLARTHFGIVVDEHGGFEGIITLEDLLEEIVGEIEDEYDESSDREIEILPDGSVIVAGATTVRDANKALDLGIPESDDYNTVVGFLMSLVGRTLTQGDRIEYDGFVFTIEKAERHRVISVRIEKLAKIEQAISAATVEND
jgi:CBS domain containing-hemolysin-like protein